MAAAGRLGTCPAAGRTQGAGPWGSPFPFPSAGASQASRICGGAAILEHSFTVMVSVYVEKSIDAGHSTAPLEANNIGWKL
jgi:hypothetical protein